MQVKNLNWEPHVTVATYMQLKKTLQLEKILIVTHMQLGEINPHATRKNLE
jgi:hypothetical protein